MSTEDQLQRARELIKAKRYDDARKLLQRIDHPKATAWLERLEGISDAVPNGAKRTTSKASGVPFWLMLVSTILIGIVGLATGFFIGNSGAISTGTQAAATPEIIWINPEFCDFSDWDNRVQGYRDDFIRAVGSNDAFLASDAATGYADINAPNCQIAQEIRSNAIQGMSNVALDLLGSDDGNAISGMLNFGYSTGLTTGYYMAQSDALQSMNDQMCAAAPELESCQE
jgi:hypothetical protein